jgi:hypothetical protein
MLTTGASHKDYNPQSLFSKMFPLRIFFLAGEGFLAYHALYLGHLYASQMIKAATMILVVKISIA